MGSSMRRIRVCATGSSTGVPRCKVSARPARRPARPGSPRAQPVPRRWRNRPRCSAVGKDPWVRPAHPESSGEDSVHRFSDVGTHDRAHLPVDLRVEAVERGGRDHVEVTHAIDSTQGASHACHAVVLSTGLDRRRPDQFVIGERADEEDLPAGKPVSLTGVRVKAEWTRVRWTTPGRVEHHEAQGADIRHSARRTASVQMPRAPRSVRSIHQPARGSDDPEMISVPAIRRSGCCARVPRGRLSGRKARRVQCVGWWQ